jgi:rhodanese-related sulfurtransferase
VSNRSAISRDDLRLKIERGDDFVLFEVLPEPYFRKQHLPGAVHMPPNEVAATAARVVPDKDADIVLYCWDDH